MSTPTDLRHLLSTHAEDAVDLPVTERLSAVRGRVRVVRRRRRASVALAALVAVLGVGTAAWLPGVVRPDVAGRPTVGGHTAPATMTSLGYGYDFERAVTGDGSAQLTLPATGRPRLVSWAGADGEVRLRSDGDLDADGVAPDTVRPGSAAFDDFVYVGPDQAQSFRVSGGGRVALAVYDLATRAPGMTDHGVTWRDEVAGGRRLGAVSGAAGQTSMSVRVVVPSSGTVSIFTPCSGVPNKTSVSVTFENGDGGFSSTGGCATGPLAWDGAADGVTHYDASVLGAPGSQVTVRLDLAREQGGRFKPVTHAPDVRLALGVYADAPSRSRVGTTDVPAFVEEAGHLWSQVEVLAGQPGSRHLRAYPEVGATPELLQVVTDRTKRGLVSTVFDGRVVATTGDARDGGGSTQTVGRLVNRSPAVDLVVARTAPDTILALVVYEQVG